MSKIIESIKFVKFDDATGTDLITCSSHHNCLHVCCQLSFGTLRHTKPVLFENNNLSSNRLINFIDQRLCKKRASQTSEKGVAVVNRGFHFKWH